MLENATPRYPQGLQGHREQHKQVKNEKFALFLEGLRGSEPLFWDGFKVLNPHPNSYHNSA